MTRAEKRRREMLKLAAVPPEGGFPMKFAVVASAIGIVVYLIAALCWTLAQAVIFAMERL